MLPDVLITLFSPPTDPALITYGVYQPWMVLLSVVVASFASWMGLHMAGQAAAANTRGLRSTALLSGSLALGSGVWAMHFIGMLAFELCTAVNYDPLITVLSMLPSVFASFVALTLIGRPQIGAGSLLSGGVLVGAGIGAMHYAGMAAMRSVLALRYDLSMFLLSIVVAVVLATLALWVRAGLARLLPRLTEKWCVVISGVVMGCAIAGMHYTGMAAARFVGTPATDAGGITNYNFLALAITLTTFAFTAFVVSVNGMVRYRALFRQLSQTDSWMRTVLQTSVDGVITVGDDGIIRDFNEAAERLFGWPREEIIGRHIGLLVADPEHSSRDGILRQVATKGAGGSGANDEVLALRRDGSTIPIRRTIGHAQLGDRIMFVCFINDITERRAIEQAMRDSEGQLRSLIGNLPGISFRCLTTHERPMLFVSEGVERITGYPVSDFTGAEVQRRYSDLIHAEDRARVCSEIGAALKDRRAYAVEYRLLHKDGSMRWVWEHGSALEDENSHVQLLDGVILDISERRDMEQALREAKERAESAAAARAAFLANMSHEIRTPMNSILGFTDLLLEEPLAPEHRRHLQTVRGAAQSLLRLLNEVLDTVKLDKGAMELEATDFDLHALLDELADTFELNARQKQLALQLERDTALPRFIRADALRIRQVLVNLLGNALKFTEQGSVRLAAFVRAGALHFDIVDTGIGIAPERLAAIFEPFTQADASMSRRFGGTGLGTTISKQLVELMGGRIWAESEIGRGSVFHVVLPLTLAGAASAETASVITLPPLTVLAVDDVAQNLELLRLMLQKQGHRISLAASGTEAIAAAARERFDLILMDVQMPGIDGLEATRRIRADEAAAGRAPVPILAMTASVLLEDRHAASRAGMDGFATKPVDWQALALEIARVLGLGLGMEQGMAAPNSASQAVLDHAAGLARWSSDPQAYGRALRQFAAASADSASECAALLAAQDHAALVALAHRLRGSAANLGLGQAATALTALEYAARDGAAHPLAQAVAALPAVLQAAHAAIAAQAAPAATAADAGALDSAAALALGEQLAQSLRRGAFDDATLQTLLAMLAGHAAQDQIAALRHAIDDFDFARAEAALAALLAPYRTKVE